jgi:hypothetical protein
MIIFQPSKHKKTHSRGVGRLKTFFYDALTPTPPLPVPVKPETAGKRAGVDVKHQTSSIGQGKGTMQVRKPV